MSHVVQSPAQELAHRKLKLEAARQARANLASNLANVRNSIANASRPRSLQDPIFANRLPNLQEHESKLVAQLAECDAHMQREYGDLLSAPALPIKSAQDAEIDRLQSLVAFLSGRLEKCRCGASAGQ